MTPLALVYHNRQKIWREPEKRKVGRGQGMIVPVMKIFLTGATGFIGGHLAQRLVESGHTLRCLVRPTARRARLERLGAELVTGDVTDPPRRGPA